MVKRGLFLLAACAPMLMVLGCPNVTPPEAVLAGRWATEDNTGGTVYLQFDATGQLQGLAVQGQNGLVLLEIANTTTTLDGDQVTITAPTVAGTATLNGTLSADQNTIDGTLTSTIEVTGDITATVPQGPVTLVRVESCGNTVCGPDEICVNGACVECENDDDCAAGEVCTNGTCEAETGCTTDTDCDAGQVCTNGECVAGGGGGDPVAGQAFYTANGCAGCHGADGSGGIGPDIRDETAAEILARLNGTDSHPITVAGVTIEDAEDVVAYLDSL